MSVRVSLTALQAMHPQLLWNEIVVAVLVTASETRVVDVALEYQNVPGFGSDDVTLRIDTSGVSSAEVARVRRTYEHPRLIELAAIAVAGMALYHGSGHEIVDVSVRGTSADYLIDASRQLLEVAGRSSRGDFESAWKQKHARLDDRGQNNYYVCVVEFETPYGRLAYTH